MIEPYRFVLKSLSHPVWVQSGFMPHGHCYLWLPSLVWTHVISDVLIGLAYMSISLSLYGLVRKIQIPFSTMVLSFGVFIAACGATHFMEVWNIWHADYWTSGVVKVLTALASVSTAIGLIAFTPKIIAFAESARVSEKRKADLERTYRILAEQQKVLAHSAKMSALGEMAGGIAHEINSPLGIITIHANQMERLLKRGSLTSEMIEKEAQLIASTAMRIGEIIKGLRAFARDGESDPFLFAPVTSIVQDALVLARNRFLFHDIELRVGAIPRGLEIECRSVQIGQVILNLLSNGFDAVQNLSEKWVALTVEESATEVMFEVTDSGRGIPPEVLPKLMEPFFTTKEIGKGTGLGLSISKGIMDAHLGSLEVDTAHPHTRFIARLPKTRDRPLRE